MKQKVVILRTTPTKTVYQIGMPFFVRTFAFYRTVAKNASISAKIPSTALRVSPVIGT